MIPWLGNWKWFQCDHGVDSLTYNHCRILVYQAFFHTELLAGEFAACLSSATHKEVNNFWVKPIGQTKYQDKVRLFSPISYFVFFLSEHKIEVWKDKLIIFLVSESQSNNEINVCFWFRFPNWILKERMRHWFSSPPLFIFWIIMPWTDRVCVSNTDTATEIEGFPLRQRGCQHRSPWISSPQWFKYTVHSVSFSLCAPSSTHAQTYTHTLTHVALRSHIQTVRWRFSAVCFGFSLCCFLLSGEQMIEGTGGRRRRRRWDSCLPIDDVE